MKLTYYLLPHQTDSACYSIRKQTKKAVIKELAEKLIDDKMNNSSHWSTSYGETRYVKNSPRGLGAVISTTVFTIRKVVIEYDNNFDLMDQLIGTEGGGEYVVKEYKYTRGEIFHFVKNWARKGRESI